MSYMEDRTTEAWTYLIPVANAIGVRDNRDNVSITWRKKNRKMFIEHVFNKA